MKRVLPYIEKSLFRVIMQLKRPMTLLLIPIGFFVANAHLHGQNCSNGTTTFDIDLSAAPNANWQTPNVVTPTGQCCGAAATHQCMEFIINLHPDANGISIAFTTPISGVYYKVNCGPTQPATSNIINICFDQGDTGPHSVTFCRSGTPSYEFTVYSIANSLDVSLQPFNPVCEESAGFMLTGGSPIGGTYYINGSAMPYFDVVLQGPGDHEITYQYNDPVSGCLGFATQTLTVVPFPIITWVTEEFCDYEGMVPLNGASPPGGNYTGNFVSSNQFNTDGTIPGTYEINYTYVDVYGCASTAQGEVIVNPPPIANAGADKVIGMGTTTNLTAAAGGPHTYSYHWEPAHLFVNPNVQNPTTLPLNVSTEFTLTVTNLTTGCQATDDVVVKITGGNLHISDVTASPDAICVGDTSQLWVLAGGGSGNYNYLWTANPADAPDFPSAVPFPLASPSVTTTYTVQITDINLPALPAATAQVTLFVNPLPVVTLNIPPTVCANTPNYSLGGGLPTGGTYTMLDDLGNVMILPYIDFSNFLPNDIGPDDYQVMYEFTDPVTGCTDFAIEPFTILPYVKAQFYTSRADICVSEEVSIANHSVGASWYTWTFGDGTSGNEAAADFVHSFPISPDIETYTIGLLAENLQGCTDYIERTVKVYPPVNAQFNASQTVGCSDLTVDFESTSTGPIYYHFWDFGDGTFSVEEDPTKTFSNHSDSDTIYTVTLTVMSENFFCISEYSLDITVYPSIVAAFGLSAIAGCHPVVTNISNMSAGATDYEWIFGDGNTSIVEIPGLYTYNNITDTVVQYPITLIASNLHCSDTVVQMVTVYPNVIADFSVPDTIGCSPLDVGFQNTSSITANWFNWNFDDGGSSSDTDPGHVFNNFGDATSIYSVTLIARSEHFCADTLSRDIYVHPFLQSGFDFNPAFACNPHDASFINTAIGADSFEWVMGDGTVYTLANDTIYHLFDHNQPIPEVYTVSQIISNTEGCTDTLERAITVYPKIDADFTISANEGCTPLEVIFTNASTGQNKQLWEFGDGSSSFALSPSHTYSNTSFTTDTIFNVWFYAESEWLCRDSIHTTITIYPDVKADFTIGDIAGCSPFTVTIENFTKGALQQDWDFGDGVQANDNSAELFHIFENFSDTPVDYEIELVATNMRGCTDTLRRTITVYPEVVADYSHDIAGCHPLNLSITNLTTNASYFSWDFGNGHTSDNFEPQHTFYNVSHLLPVVFDVEYYASSIYGCFATGSTQVEVYPKPDADFTITNSPACSPHNLQIVNQSVGVDDLLWDFGDGSAAQTLNQDTISYAYNVEPGLGPQTFQIILTAENSFGCLDTLQQEAVIFPNVNADFTVDVVEGCHPLTVEFTNLSTGATATGAYEWRYGDGYSSHVPVASHQHTFHNYSPFNDTIYTVELTAYNQNECYSTFTRQIRVLPRPQASFSVPNNPGCAPHNLIINNQTLGATSFTWIMGDGDTLTTIQPVFTHLYNQPSNAGPGVYTIQLDVENQHLCYDTFSQQVIIYPEIVPAFDGVLEGCHPHQVSFSNQSVGGDIFSWDFANGQTSQQSAPSQVFTNFSNTESKFYPVTLTVESSWGCVADTTLQVEVYPLPLPSFELVPASGCAPFSPEVINHSVGGTEFSWDFGNGTSQLGDSILYHTWDNNTVGVLQFPLSLSVTNQQGCTAVSGQFTSVYPEVHAGFSTEDGLWQGCSPLTVKFENQSQLTDSYKWDFSEGSTSSSASPLFVFYNETTMDRVFPVGMVATSIYGCTDTIVHDITVFPTPEAEFMAYPEVQPFPNTEVTFMNTTNDGFWDFDWDFGDGTDGWSDTFDPMIHNFERDANDMSTIEYLVTLTAYSEYCTDTFSKIIRITSPVPESAFTSLQAGCVPFTVNFNNNSEYAYDYRWSFGDGSISTDASPEHTYFDPGIFDVMLVSIGDGGSDTIFQKVEAIENPQASFSIVEPFLSIPEDPLLVINYSYLADTYQWIFGDGNTSDDFEPVYYFTEPGVYDITLVATRSTQPLCHDTLTLENAVRVEETCKLVFPDAFIPDPSGPSGGAIDPLNPSVSIFHPVYEGVDEYRLEIFTRWGEQIFSTNNVNVGWDGYYQSRLANMDVYVWKATGRCSNGKSFIHAGDVTLYR